MAPSCIYCSKSSAAFGSASSIVQKGITLSPYDSLTCLINSSQWASYPLLSGDEPVGTKTTLEIPKQPAAFRNVSIEPFFRKCSCISTFHKVHQAAVYPLRQEDHLKSAL